MDPEADAKAIFRVLGVPATHEGADTTVILERGVEVFHGHAVVRENHVSLIHAWLDVPPESGQTVIVDGQPWLLGERVNDDDVVVKFAARKS